MLQLAASESQVFKIMVRGVEFYIAVKGVRGNGTHLLFDAPDDVEIRRMKITPNPNARQRIEQARVQTA